MKCFATTLAVTLISLTVAPSLNAEVFTNSYTVTECQDYELITQMLIGPGVARHPVGALIRQSKPYQVGVFSNLVAKVIPSFTNGVILSTGKIDQGVSRTNEWSNAYWEGEAIWPYGFPTEYGSDPDLKEYFGYDLYDQAGIVLYIQPRNKTINIPFVMASEQFYYDSDYSEYPDLDEYEERSDKFVFFLKEVADVSDPSAYDKDGNVIDDGSLMTWNIAQLPGGGDVEITSVNQHTNTQYFISNVVSNEDGELEFPAEAINLPMEFNGAIVGPVAVAEGLDTNKIYKLKIIVADKYNNIVNSVIFLRDRGITSGADLKIDVSGPTSMAEPGEVMFTDTVSNIGPAPADGVVVTNYLPIGATYVSCVPSATSFVTNSFGVTNGLVWTIGDRFQHGSNAVMTVTCNLPEAGWYTNIATVATDTGDYNPDNDRDQALVKVGSLPELTIAAVNLKKAFGEEITLADLGFVASVEGTNSTHKLTGIDVTFTNAQGQAANPAPTNALASVGKYGICLANVKGDNLDMFGSRITYVPGTLEITNANLKIKGATVKKCYGEPYAFTGKEFEPVTGLPAGVSVTSVVVTSGNPAGTNVTDAVGEYPFDIMDAKGPGISNYTITYDPGLLIVTQRCVKVTADNKSMVYGTTPPPTPTYGPVAGIVAGDFLDVRLAYTNEGESATWTSGIYPDAITTNALITVTNAAGAVKTANYLIAFEPGDLEVTDAEFKIKPGDAVRTYDGIPTNIVVTVTSGPAAYNIYYRNVGETDDAAWLDYGEWPSARKYVNVADSTNVEFKVEAANYTTFFGTNKVTILARQINGLQPGVTPPSPGDATKPWAKAGNVVKCYDGEGTNITYASGNIVPGNTVEYKFAYTASAPAMGDGVWTDYANVFTNAVDATNVWCRVTAGDNYFGAIVSATVTITQRCVTVTANDTNMVYGTTPHPTPTWRGGEGLLDGDGLKVELGYTNTVWDVGVYPAAISTNALIAVTNAAGDVTANYLIAFEPGDLEVTDAAFVVESGDAVRTYDGIPTNIVVTVTSGPAAYDIYYRNKGETEDSAWLDYGSWASLGKYVNVADTTNVEFKVEAANYTTFFGTNKVTILARQIEGLPSDSALPPSGDVTKPWAKAGNVVKCYDGEGTNITYASGNIVPGNPVEYKFAYTASAPAMGDGVWTDYANVFTNAVDATNVWCRVTAGDNYFGAIVSATVTITQRCVTVTANDTNMVYGTTAPAVADLAWRNDGLSAGDRTCVSLDYTNEVWDVGVYPDAITTNAAIVISNATGDVTANYLIAFEPGDLEVTPLRATVAVTNVMTCYDAEPHTIGYSSVPVDATFHFATNNGAAWVWMDAPPQFTEVCTDVPVLVWADKLPDYTASPTNTAYVTITQKVVTVTLNNQTNAYKSAAGAWTVKGVEGLIPGHGALTGVPGAIVGTPPTQVEGSPHAVTVGAGTLSAGPNYQVVVKEPTLTITPLQIWPLPPEASAEPRIWAPDVVKAYDGKGTNVVAAAYDVDDPVTFSYSTNGTTWVDWEALQFSKVAYDAEGNVTSNKVHYKVNEDSCHNYIPTNWVAWVTITQRVGFAELRTSVSAKLNWNTGLLDLTLTVTNEGDAAVEPGSDYWVELAPGPAADGVARTFYVDSPTGTLPDGADYIDLSGAVRAALKATGNRDEVFDPGETVTLTDVSVYHWKRWSPEKFIDMEQFFKAGLLDERTQSGGRDVAMALASFQTTAPLRLGPAPGVDAPAETSLANVYDGVLYDGDALAGTIHVQVAKVNKKTGLSNLTATLVPVGGQKVTVSGSFDPNAASFVATAKDGRRLELFVGKDGLGGSFDGFEVDGARNRYSSKDAEDKAVVATADALIGSYSLANPCENGWEAYVVKIAKKGKVTIAGTLVDGSTVSASAQMITGATGCCVPVIVSKKSVSRTFCIWFGENGIGIDGLDGAVIEHVGNLAAAGLLTFDVEKLLSLLENETRTVLSDYLPNGAEVLPNGKKWVVMPDAAGKALKTGSIVWDGKNGVVKTEKSKIDGFNVSGLKFTYTATTGVFKGSFKVFEIVKGGLKAVTANVTGVVVDGVGYGTVRVDKSGTVAAVIE